MFFFFLEHFRLGFQKIFLSINGSEKTNFWVFFSYKNLFRTEFPAFFYLQGNGLERNLKVPSVFIFHGLVRKGFRAFLSSAEWLGKEFRLFSISWNIRISIGMNPSFRLFHVPWNNFFLGKRHPCSAEQPNNSSTKNISCDTEDVPTTRANILAKQGQKIKGSILLGLPLTVGTYSSRIVSCLHPTTGRQLRTLFSVLYRIISKRRYILAAQLLLREKSGT